ncbi:TraR/DksA family transcriptional regulator [Sphingopyxis kveilinensis]|uniref:TraR/DksA family transcriptional regulator n=1 Tax=Sphingopyxis kveilinensis TaxID=3114367 RepID=UPI0030D1D900
MDAATVRAQLEARLLALGARVDDIETTQREPLGDDFADQAVARQDDESLDAIESAALEEAALTRQALARLDAGTYGICVGCGKPISAERLRALPIASHCIACARGTER